mgnify:FL=1
MRGGSLILPNAERVSLGNSDFSAYVFLAQHVDIEEQQEIEEEVEEAAANLGG